MGLEEQSKEFVDKLLKVREGYICAIDELKVSIRRDEVAVQLKEILDSNPDIHMLRSALENYIQELYNLDKKEDDKDDGDTNNEENI